MLKSITTFFEDFLIDTNQDTASPGTHSIHFATATLLMEVSRSDQEHQTVEINAILAILKRLFDFSEIEVSELVDLARDASDEAHDLYSFTSLINEHYDYQAKRQLVKNLWEVAFADGRIDAFEEHIIRRIAGLIHVTDQDFIRAKILARKNS